MVIVVVGSPVAVRTGKRIRPAGRSVAVAQAIRQAGGEPQLVGKIADDLAGDAIVIDLGRRGIGHAALARAESGLTPSATTTARDGDDTSADAELLAGEGEETTTAPPGTSQLPDGIPLEAADLKLALGYLPEIGAIVVAAPLTEEAAKVVADAAAYHEVPLVVLVEPDRRVPPAFANAVVLEAPEAEDSFDRLVGAFAIRLERGDDAREALRDAVAVGGWERASG